jgi:glycosyltransferase involved in cell wall biosynthesis
MRIVLVRGICETGACGVGDYAQRLAHALRSLGVEAELMSEGRWGLLDIRSASESVDRLNPDIIHIQYPTAGFGHKLGPQLFVTGRSSVVTLHEASQSHILRKLSLYPFTLRAQHLIFTSEYERIFAKKWAPWIARISSVIPIGSNIDAVPNSVAQRSHEVAYFGLIMPGKGLEEILKLAYLIQSVGSTLKLRVIGKASSKHEAYFERLRLRSAELPIIWDAELNNDQVATRLAGCSVAYLPFPDGASDRRSTLKAMLASGVAVVTTRSSHTPTSLESVVRFANSVEDSYAVIERLMNDRQEREKLRDKAIEYMRQFTWDRIASLHLHVYESVQATLRSGG